MPRIDPSKREPTFEAVIVGEEIGPTEIVADLHYARQAMFATDDYDPWYASDTAHPQGPLVPPGAIMRDLVAHFCELYDASRVVGLHQHEEVWFHAPVPLGTRLRYFGRYIDKYERRGKGYVVFESEARNAETGELLVRQISTEIMRVPEKVELGSSSAPPPQERVTGVWPEGVAPAARAHADIATGTPIPTLTKTAWQDQMAVFSGCNKHWANIHTSLDVAEKAGFRDTLAQGAMETAWSAQMLARFFGESWLTTGWIKHVYLKPVFRGDTITLRGVVKSVETGDHATTITLEVWAENQDGVMTAAGWAKAAI